MENSEKNREITDFKEAREAATLFDMERGTETAEPEVTAIEQPATAQEGVSETAKVSTESVPQPDAVKVAELATQEFVKSKEEIERLQSENEQLRNILDRINTDNEVQLTADSIGDFDFSQLAFMEDDERNAVMQNFMNSISENAANKIFKDLKPLIERSQAAIQEQEENNIYDMMKSAPEFKDIDRYIPQIKKLINDNPVLRNGDFSTEEKIATAFLIAQGVEKANADSKKPEKMTNEEFYKLYEENPEFQEFVRNKTIEKIKPNQQVPVFSASSGATNAALNIKESPKSFKEARELAKKY